MRALLDEMYPAAVAEGLRRRGHDVAGVQERPELRGRDDADLLAAATAEGRLLVTENVADFAVLASRWAAEGRAHAGILFTSNTAFPRHGRRFVGRLVEALDAELAASSSTPPRPPVTWL